MTRGTSAFLAIAVIGIIAGLWLWTGGYLNDMLGIPSLTIQPSTIKQGNTVTSTIKFFPANTQVWSNQYPSGSFMVGTTDANGFLQVSGQINLSPGTYVFTVYTADSSTQASATLTVIA